MDADTKEIIDREVESALKVLRAGGIILYPTDTVWGIGADATNPDAVAKIYALKRREDSKSMLSLVESTESLYLWLDNVPETALMLLEAAVDPLTIIYDSPRGLAPNLLAEDGSAGMRVTKERFTARLCRRLGRPLVSTSANISGSPAAPTFDLIPDEIKAGVDHIVDYRRDDRTPHKPSGIIKVTDRETFRIIR